MNLEYQEKIKIGLIEILDKVQKDSLDTMQLASALVVTLNLSDNCWELIHEILCAFSYNEREEAVSEAAAGDSW